MNAQGFHLMKRVLIGSKCFSGTELRALDPKAETEEGLPDRTDKIDSRASK